MESKKPEDDFYNYRLEPWATIYEEKVAAGEDPMKVEAEMLKSMTQVLEDLRLGGQEEHDSWSWVDELHEYSYEEPSSSEERDTECLRQVCRTLDRLVSVLERGFSNNETQNNS